MNKEESYGIGVYVHVPFCLSKCSYCGFYSVTSNEDSVQSWLHRLEEEASEALSSEIAHKVKTVFIGGGNPTSIGTKNLESTLDILKRKLNEADIVEWSVETNPETLTRETAKVLARLPKLRLSLGVQRFNDKELGILGRSGSYTAGVSAVERALALTSNVNIDLILGIPNVRSIAPDLALFVEKFPIAHVSAYLLSLEDGTPLSSKVHAGDFPDPREIGPEELFEVAEALKNYGFEQYEISNFAKSNRRCLHNMNYWLGGEYVGLGPAAVGSMAGIRKANPANLSLWLNKQTPLIERLSPLDCFRESVMLRLRLVNDGLDLNWLERKYKKLSSSFNKALEAQIAAGNIIRSGSVVKLSRQGIAFANGIIAELF